MTRPRSALPKKSTETRKRAAQRVSENLVAAAAPEAPVDPERSVDPDPPESAGAAIVATEAFI